jgi:hypothetical protein
MCIYKLNKILLYKKYFAFLNECQRKDVYNGFAIVTGMKVVEREEG